jgi:hypothetical protein
VKRASALAIALAATTALPASALASTQSYKVVKAAGTEKVEFAADAKTCARFLTCGYAGTVTYTFGGTPSGKLVLRKDARGRVKGAAAFTSRGKTVSDLTSGAVCTDTVRHKREQFSIASKSRLGRLVFGLHGARIDYLVTDCAGPTEAQLERDGALPNGTFKRTAFEARTTTFGLTGSASFREAGYLGKASWKLSYRVRRGS